MDQQELTARFDRLAALKAHAQRMKHEYDSAKAEMEAFQHELFQDCRAADLFSAKTSAGQFSLKSTIYSTVNDRDALVKWAHERDMSELVHEVENKGRLNEIVRACIDNGEELPPGVGFYAKEYISVTTSKNGD